jgi:hypothetical protein
MPKNEAQGTRIMVPDVIIQRHGDLFSRSKLGTAKVAPEVAYFREERDASLARLMLDFGTWE